MAHVWLAMHGWSTIPEFYYLIYFVNVILKLCLYCKEIIPFLLFFCFWSHCLTFLLLIHFNFMSNYFCPKDYYHWSLLLIFIIIDLYYHWSLLLIFIIIDLYYHWFLLSLIFIIINLNTILLNYLNFIDTTTILIITLILNPYN